MGQVRLYNSEKPVDVVSTMVAAEAGDYASFGLFLAEAYVAAMQEVSSQMEAEGYSPDKDQMPTLIIRFESKGVKNGGN